MFMYGSASRNLMRLIGGYIKKGVMNMKMSKPDWKAEFCTTMSKLSRHRSIWQVWSDFIFLSASTISNRIRTKTWNEREKEYLSIIHTYPKDEQKILSQLLGTVQLAYMENDEQDFLGSVCMSLELNGKRKMQYFSPYCISVLMTELICCESTWMEALKKKGYASVYDPTCGAGTMLIAFAQSVKKKGINPQTRILFVGQDIDRSAALMCYIQLSILGLPGYVIVGDTLSSPGRLPDNEIWYTPGYFINAERFVDNEVFSQEDCGQSGHFDLRITGKTGDAGEEKAG